MRTVAHLRARGFDVELYDLCEEGGYDFLAKDGQIAIEVECKSVSGDLGHRVGGAVDRGGPAYRDEPMRRDFPAVP